MASSQYASLAPLQHYTQQQQQQQQAQQQQRQQQAQQHYNHITFQHLQPRQQIPSNHNGHGPAASHVQSQSQPQPQPIPHPPHTHPHSHSQAPLQPQIQPQLQQLQQVQHVQDIVLSPQLQPQPQPNPQATASPSTPVQPKPQRQRRKGGRPPKRPRTDEAPPPSSPARTDAPPPPPPPPVQPFSRGPYNTLEDAVFSLQLHVFTSGYGVSQKRTVKEKLSSGRYDPEGAVIRKDFACDRGGNEFVSQSRGERRRESKKCGCGWKAAVRRLRREGDRWFVEILDPHHNHPATPWDGMHAMASYRRWLRENNAGVRGAVNRLTRAAAMPALRIAAYLKGDFQDPDLDRIDRQVLRALSISDAELPGGDDDDDGGKVTSVAFETIANRPTVTLQMLPNDAAADAETTPDGTPTTAAVPNNGGFGVL